MSGLFIAKIAKGLSLEVLSAMLAAKALACAVAFSKSYFSIVSNIASIDFFFVSICSHKSALRSPAGLLKAVSDVNIVYEALIVANSFKSKLP